MPRHPTSVEGAGELSVADFTTLFAETIRVQVDWSRVQGARGRVSTMILSEREELKSFFFPWYLAADLGETTWQDREGIAVRADDLPRRLRELSPTRQETVLELARDFARSRQPILMILAAYRLTSGCWLLLDGNHRVAALRVRSVSFRALLIGLDAPLDRRMVPDLVKHGG